MFNRCSCINQVDSLLPTARYTLFRAASWKQPAEGCAGSDHGGTAAVHATGGALWHAAPGATWPAQVRARPSAMTPNAHMWDLWIYTSSWVSDTPSSCHCQGVSHPCREDWDGSQPEEAVPRWRGGHWWVHEIDEGIWTGNVGPHALYFANLNAHFERHFNKVGWTYVFFK